VNFGEYRQSPSGPWLLSTAAEVREIAQSKSLKLAGLASDLADRPSLAPPKHPDLPPADAGSYLCARCEKWGHQTRAVTSASEFARVHGLLRARDVLLMLEMMLVSYLGGEG
jgi:hypothetical protein